MPKYQDDIIGDLKAKVKHIEEQLKTTPVKWAYGNALESAKTQLALARLGIHRIQANQCNCGLFVERSIKLGHRDFETKMTTTKFQLVIDL